jgi:hypothetical protein
MKKMFGLVALLALSSLPALAQDTPKLEVGGGYAYRSWGIASDNDGSRFSMNGWNANADYNVTDKVGVALNLTGTHSGAQDATQWIYGFMAGPRFYPMGHHKLSPFVHAMAGLTRYSIYVPDPEFPLSYSENHLGVDFGGGIDAMVTNRIGVRVAQFDYERTVFNAFQNLPAQNNFIFSAGVVVHFGAK